MATWTMPMYTAASPGNLLPMFSEPKIPPGPGGTMAHRASVLQKATGVVAARWFAAGAHWLVGGGVAPTPAPVPTKAAAPMSTASTANLDFTVPPFLTGSPRRHGAARAQRAERPGRPCGPTEPRT